MLFPPVVSDTAPYAATSGFPLQARMTPARVNRLWSQQGAHTWLRLPLRGPVPASVCEPGRSLTCVLMMHGRAGSSVMQGSQTPGTPSAMAIGRSYEFGSLVPFDEDSAHEFKAVHKTSQPAQRIVDYTTRYANAFLNSNGGVCYYGIEDDGLVHGVPLTRSQRDDIRLRVDFAIESFWPAVDPDLIHLDFIPVVNAPDSACAPFVTPSAASRIGTPRQTRKKNTVSRDRDADADNSRGSGAVESSAASAAASTPPSLGVADRRPQHAGMQTPELFVVELSVQRGRAPVYLVSKNKPTGFIRRNGSVFNMSVEMVLQRLGTRGSNDLAHMSAHAATPVQQQQQQQQQLPQQPAAVVASSSQAVPLSRALTYCIDAAPQHFVGRVKELQQVQSYITAEGAAAVSPVRVISLYGAGGCGKTSLARRISSVLADDFPDGQFAIKLGGTTPQPVGARDAMVFTIRAFHPTIEMPSTTKEIEGYYLGCFHNKRSILLLDDASSKDDQVLPLLPKSDCVVIVTSRQSLGLVAEVGALELHVGELSLDESVDVLLSMLQEQDTRVPLLSRDQAVRVAHVCGCYPLALHVVGGMFRKMRNRKPEAIIEQLEQEASEILLMDNRKVEQCLRASFDLLSAAQQRLFVALSVFPGSFDDAAAAAIWGVSEAEAANHLSEFMLHSMVEFTSSTWRYRLHDTMRSFTCLLAKQVADAKTQRAWAQALLQHMLRVMRQIQSLCACGGEDMLTGNQRFDREAKNIKHAIALSVALRTSHCVRIALVGHTVFRARMHPGVLIDLYSPILDLITPPALLRQRQQVLGTAGVDAAPSTAAVRRHGHRGDGNAAVSVHNMFDVLRSESPALGNGNGSGSSYGQGGSADGTAEATRRRTRRGRRRRQRRSAASGVDADIEDEDEAVVLDDDDDDDDDGSDDNDGDGDGNDGDVDVAAGADGSVDAAHTVMLGSISLRALRQQYRRAFLTNEIGFARAASGMYDQAAQLYDQCVAQVTRLLHRTGYTTYAEPVPVSAPPSSLASSPSEAAAATSPSTSTTTSTTTTTLDRSVLSPLLQTPPLSHVRAAPSTESLSGGASTTAAVPAPADIPLAVVSRPPAAAAVAVIDTVLLLCDALLNQGDLFSERCDFSKAEEAMLRCVVNLERVNTDASLTCHADVSMQMRTQLAMADSLLRLGQVDVGRANMARAEQMYLRALKIYQASHGGVDAKLAKCHDCLCKLHIVCGNYQTALRYNDLALEAKMRTFGRAHLEVALTRHDRGKVYALRGEYGRARDEYKAALLIREQALTPGHPLIANSLRHMGFLHFYTGNYEAAEELYTQARGMLEKSVGQHHREMAIVLNDSALIISHAGRPAEEAKTLFFQSLELRKRLFGPNHPWIAICLNNIGNLYRLQKKYDEAEEYYRRALEIREEKFGREHPEVARTVHNLAALRLHQRRYQEALELYQRALDIRVKLLGDAHPEVATSRSGLGHVYEHLREFDRAEDCFLASLEINSTAFGQDNVTVATNSANLGHFYLNRERWHESQQYLDRAAAVIARVFAHDPTSLRWKSVVELQIQLHRSWGQDHIKHERVDDAVTCFQQCLVHLQRYLDDTPSSDPMRRRRANEQANLTRLLHKLQTRGVAYCQHINRGRFAGTSPTVSSSSASSPSTGQHRRRKSSVTVESGGSSESSDPQDAAAEAAAAAAAAAAADSRDGGEGDEAPTHSSSSLSSWPLLTSAVVLGLGVAVAVLRRNHS